MKIICFSTPGLLWEYQLPDTDSFTHSKTCILSLLGGILLGIAIGTYSANSQLFVGQMGDHSYFVSDYFWQLIVQFIWCLHCLAMSSHATYLFEALESKQVIEDF
ncbi:uncharacterized protein LOC131071987 isoform X2 [Cryptomeria japonica]|uniref:uncharacterized protein LOC131071987 isoform X2 n=1 Tax=Cryptomeria japonica TaxID=3369 RepID=UPI0025ACACE0|nr:uncharacterized protein LOC131071987 isoform X2 [Cryptomeria japonica]